MLIAQISDLHVCEPGRLYADHVPSDAMARAAVATVARMDPQPDLVVVTGDLTEDGSPAAYRAVRAILDGLRTPVVVLPGNHDDRDALREAFADHRHLPASGALHFSLDAGPLRIVALDTTVPGAHHGEVGAAGLAWLSACLVAGGGRPTLLLMHHHPFASGMGFIDRYRLMTAQAVEGIVARHPEVERVLCGHVHRAMAVRFGGTLAMSCPSTCSQIALRLGPGAEPASLLEPPGGILHLWRADAPMVSHLFPIGDYGAPMGFF